MIAVDTNLLIYAHRTRVPEHGKARAAIESAARTGRWGIAAPSVAEFWSIVTHPSSSGRPSRSEEARAFIRALVEDAGAHLWRPGPGFAERLMRVAADSGVVGPRVFDLQIALTALDNGALEIWTHDRSFSTVPGLGVEFPLG